MDETFTGCDDNCRLPSSTDSGDLDLCSMTNISEKFEIFYRFAQLTTKIDQNYQFALGTLVRKTHLMQWRLSQFSGRIIEKFHQYFYEGDCKRTYLNFHV